MSLPTFFGRATAASAQHVHLATLLRELGVACSTLGQGEYSSASELMRVLGALGKEMRGHFRAEEAEGYFGTLVSEVPALLPRIAELRADHTRMLELVEELRDLAKDSDRHSALASRVSSLIERFNAHERIEADLVGTFLLREQGLEDA